MEKFMNEKEIAAFFHKVPLFQNLKPHQFTSLAKLTYEREYTAGSVIVKQGEGGIGLFIILSGKAEAMRERPDGTTAVLNHFEPKDFFGELALLDEGVRTASVVATEPTKCLAISRWDFLVLLKTDADMAVTVLTELGRRFRMVLEASM
jgi:CRP/FNR family transcriptional regulator, cyclic AMP receptor protein